MTTWCPITHVYAVMQKIVCTTNLSYLLKQITTITYLILQKFYLMSKPKMKYTKYICKQCQTILKSGKSPFGRDSNTCNDMCEYDEKCAEHNVSIHDYTCTCCHDGKQQKTFVYKV